MIALTFMLFILQILLLRGFYLLERRVTNLEGRKPEQQKPVQHVPDWQKPVENFNPPKPETLRPGQLRGREADERVFEFDVKIQG